MRMEGMWNETGMHSADIPHSTEWRVGKGLEDLPTTFRGMSSKKVP